MKARLAMGPLLTLFTGCVADTMRGYVGQDIRAVMLAYGPPANEIDLGGGTRAFQWSKTSVDTTDLPPFWWTRITAYAAAAICSLWLGVT
jgi:hypothetical protein